MKRLSLRSLKEKRIEIPYVGNFAASQHVNRQISAEFRRFALERRRRSPAGAALSDLPARGISTKTGLARSATADDLTAERRIEANIGFGMRQWAVADSQLGKPSAAPPPRTRSASRSSARRRIYDLGF